MLSYSVSHLITILGMAYKYGISQAQRRSPPPETQEGVNTRAE